MWLTVMGCERATFGVFAFACSAGYIWATHFVPETAGVSLEEIDAVFKSEAGRRDAEAKTEVREFPIPA